MNSSSIPQNSGYYPPTQQSQMNATSQGLQQNQYALSEEEAQTLQQLIGAGALSGAAVGAVKQNEFGVSSLGWGGFFQSNWNDQSMLENGVLKNVSPLENWTNTNHYNQRYGKNGIAGFERAAAKQGMALLGPDGKPVNFKVNNLADNTVRLQAHTVDLDGNVLQYGARNNNFFQKAKNIVPNWNGSDASGTYGDSLSTTRGYSAPVAESGRQYANSLEKIRTLKASKADSKLIEAAKVASANDLLKFDQTRLQEASKALTNHEIVLKLETDTLANLQKGGDTAKINAQKARVAQIQKVTDAQKNHVIKLNNKNAKIVAKHLSNNIDEVAEGLMKKPTILQKAFNLFNGDKTKAMQIYNQLQSHGFDEVQLKTIQDAIKTGKTDTVKNALLEVAKDNKVKASTIAKSAKSGLGVLDDGAKTALDATVKSKSAMGGLRNGLGVMGKVTKGLAIVGATLEVLNFGNNLKNGDQRKAFSDLTTNVGAGLLTAGVIGVLGLPFLPALAAGAVLGWGISKVAAPLVDKGFKALGLTNKNERDAKKAKGELQQFDQRLDSAPTVMAPA